MTNKSGQYKLISAVLFFILCTHAITCYASGTIKNNKYSVIDVYPHDKNAQTEGLIYLNGYIYEGTGPCKDGPSSLRKLDINTGKALQYLSLKPPIFGEGITVFGDRIIQLTYKAKTGYVYGLKDFDLLEKFHYKTEGWGLTNDGSHLIMSDGTSTLHFFDPHTFKEIKKLNVHDDKGDVKRVNELEYINGYIYANIFLTDRIIIISPDTGKVLRSLHLKEILKGYYRPGYDDPANGIAYDAENNHLLITGKYWPNLFRVKISKE